MTKQKLILVFAFLLIASNLYCQKSDSEKAMNKIFRYSKTLKKALKHPLKAKYVYIDNYTDSVFPNADILKLSNIEQISLFAKSFYRKKKTVSLVEPVQIKLRVDTVKLKQLPKLKYLSFSYFNFRKFPTELCYLKNLKGLNVSVCDIDSLPAEIENLKNLQVLMMRLNNLNKLPNSFRNLDSLYILDLANNSFEEFPKVLCEMQNLKKVIFANVENPKEEIWHWKWTYPIHINKIDYYLNLETLKILLMHSKLEKILLQTDTEESKLKIKENIGEDLFQKTSWKINANYQ